MGFRKILGPQKLVFFGSGAKGPAGVQVWIFHVLPCWTPTLTFREITFDCEGEICIWTLLIAQKYKGNFWRIRIKLRDRDIHTHSSLHWVRLVMGHPLPSLSFIIPWPIARIFV